MDDARAKTDISDLRPDQPVVYFWSWENERTVKIGHSTLGGYYASVILQRTRYSHKKPIDHGFIRCERKSDALSLEQRLLQRFSRINTTEWVHLTEEVQDYIAAECIEIKVSALRQLHRAAKRQQSGMRGRTLKEKRTAILMLLGGKTQKEIARRYNTTQKSVSDWMRSEDCKEIRDEMLKNLCKLYDIDLTDITGETNDS